MIWIKIDGDWQETKLFIEWGGGVNFVNGLKLIASKASDEKSSSW